MFITASVWNNRLHGAKEIIGPVGAARIPQFHSQTRSRPRRRPARVGSARTRRVSRRTVGRGVPVLRPEWRIAPRLWRPPWQAARPRVPVGRSRHAPVRYLLSERPRARNGAPVVKRWPPARHLPDALRHRHRPLVAGNVDEAAPNLSRRSAIREERETSRLRMVAERRSAVRASGAALVDERAAWHRARMERSRVAAPGVSPVLRSRPSCDTAVVRSQTET